eukprot:365236-Chlamydomonas_euryale.AAC.4
MPGATDALRSFLASARALIDRHRSSTEPGGSGGGSPPPAASIACTAKVSRRVCGNRVSNEGVGTGVSNEGVGTGLAMRVWEQGEQ